VLSVFVMPDAMLSDVLLSADMLCDGALAASKHSSLLQRVIICRSKNFIRQAREF
jgi:hypothetical protein